MRLTLSLFSVGMLAWAAHSAPIPAAETTSPIAKARKALETRVTTKIENRPLTEALSVLSGMAKTEIQFDRSLQMFGLDPNQTMITLDARDIPLSEALNRALKDYNLRYGLTAAGIVVSSDDGIITQQMRQRVDVNAENELLGDVVKRLADDNGVTLVLDPRAVDRIRDTKISLKVKNTPVETAIRLSAELGGFAVVRLSSVLYLTSEARAEKLRADADRPASPLQIAPIFGGVDFGGVVPGAPGGGAAPAIPPAAGEVVPNVAPAQPERPAPPERK